MCRLSLCRSQFEMTVPPPSKGRKSESLPYQPIHVIEHQHLSQDELVLGSQLQFANRLVPELQELGPGQLVLVFVNALFDEFIVCPPQ